MADGMLCVDPIHRKICRGCGKLVPRTEFSAEPRTKDGLQAKCKECLLVYRAAWRARNKERIAEYYQTFRANSPDKLRRQQLLGIAKLKSDRAERRRLAGKFPLQVRVTELGRFCTNCQERKAETEFGADKFYCKVCARVRSVDVRRRPQTIEYRRKYMRAMALRRYGLTPETFQEMWLSQKGCCAICEEAFGTGPRDVGVDHCHRTGKVRGLLCVKCNAGLGQFRDNEKYMLAAIGYLRTHRNEGIPE